MARATVLAIITLNGKLKMEKIKCYLDIKPLIAVITYGNTSTDDEVCGGLLGINQANNGWIRIMDFDPWKNIGRNNTRVDYVPNPNDLLNTLKKTTHINPNANRDFVGVFHTHPGLSIPIPSHTDIFGNGQGEANNSGYAGIYLIYSPGCARFSAQYYDGEEFGFKEVEVIVKEIESHRTAFNESAITDNMKHGDMI